MYDSSKWLQCVVDYDHKSFEVFVNDILIQGDLKFKFSTKKKQKKKTFWNIFLCFYKLVWNMLFIRMFMISFIE